MSLPRSTHGFDDELSTLSEEVDESLGQRVPLFPALVLLWSSDDASRVGEICLLPPGEPLGPPRVFGRGGPRNDDPHRRLPLLRDGASGSEEAEAVSDRHISRVQLVLRARASGAIAVENVGRCHAYKNGERFDSTELEVGDVLRLGRQLLFLCTPRAVWTPGARGASKHAFGRVDGHGLVGESPAIRELRANIRAAAAEKEHVLLLGETGTGKELVARAIHAEATDRDRPLVARNAATLPEGLIDAELFGSARNYPSAGMPERPGLIGQAHDSTLFLDEFGELSQALQVHLLRVLDEGEYQRLGESLPRRSTFRLIAATNRPAEALRDDVLARFKLRIVLPPLSKRREDIPLIAQHLLEERAGAVSHRNTVKKLPLSLVEKLVMHPFPANVRELEALIVRFSTDARFETWSDVWERNRQPAARSNGIDPATLTRYRIEQCLEENEWVQEKAWRALGLSSRHALARLLKKFSIAEPPSGS